MTELTDKELNTYDNVKINDDWILLDNTETNNLSIVTIVGKKIMSDYTSHIIYYRKRCHTDIRKISLEDFFKLSIKKIEKNVSLPIQIDTWYENKNLIKKYMNKFVVGYNLQKVWYRVNDNEFIISDSLKEFLKTHEQKKIP